MPRRRSPGADDGGFSLIEVVVAMTVFAVLVSLVLGLILRTAQVARSNNSRVVAASLANRQIESVRGQRAVDVPDGGATRTDTVGNITYTIKQTANYLPPDSTTSVCASSGSQLAYKLVTVQVTWPNMGQVEPVRADTLIALGVGTDGLDDTKGSVALAVMGATGAAVSGITVTLSSGAAVTTGEDGCAVFTGLDPGSYTATADASGHVGVANTQLASVSSIGVGAAAIARASLVYDTTRSVTLELGGPAGYTLPGGIPLVFRNTYLGPVSYPDCGGTPEGCVTGFPGQANSLFPATYEVWAGTCADANVPTTFDVTPQSADGSTVTVGLGSALVDVQVAGVSTAGRTLYAVHDVETSGGTPSCASGVSYPLPASQAGGIGVLLPYGTWTFSLTPFTPGHTPPTGSVTATLTGSGTENVTLVSAS